MIDYNNLIDWLRRRVGDTGQVRHWSNEYLKHAVEEAIVMVANDIPEGFTALVDLPVNDDKQTVDLPANGIVFTRAYGEVVDGRIAKTLIWASETATSKADPCWRESTTSITHAVYTDDQDRVWLNGSSEGPIRCSVAVLPDPLIGEETEPKIQANLSYRNLIQYAALVAMYGLTSNGAGKMDMYNKMYLQALERRRITNTFNIKNLTESER